MLDLNKDKDRLELEDALRKRDAVSVPWLQKEYGLTYAQARPLVSELVSMLILEGESDGLEFSVIHRNLVFRRLERNEFDPLYNAFVASDIRLLEAIVKNKKSTFEELAKRDRTKTMLSKSTSEKLQMFLEYRLISEINGYYVPRISEFTVEVLCEIFLRKANTKQTAEEKKYVAMLFERLFDE